MFGDLPLRRLEEGETSGGVEVQIVAPPPAPGGARRREAASARELQDVAVEVVSEHPKEDAERLIRGFLARLTAARRRKRTSNDSSKLFNQQFELGRGFTKSLLSTYTAILCFPGISCTSRKHPASSTTMPLRRVLRFPLELAAGRRTPRRCAEAKRLSQPEVLRAQTDRLLNDPKSRRFIDAFTDYWLDLRKIDDSSPSTTLYNDYELDDPLKLAAVEETRLFVQELFNANLPARNIVRFRLHVPQRAAGEALRQFPA